MVHEPCINKSRGPANDRAVAFVWAGLPPCPADSQNHHCVSEAEKAVALLYCRGICTHRALIAVKSAYQHDKRGFRQMEIGDETVQHAEGKAGINKNIGVTAASPYFTVPRRSCLQRAAACGAYGDHPVPSRFGAADGLRCLFADGIPFTVHFMGKDIVLLNWAKGAEANMQRHFGKLYARLPQVLHQLRRKVQARRGAAALPSSLAYTVWYWD